MIKRDVIAIGSTVRDAFFEADFKFTRWPDTPSGKALVLPFGEKQFIDKVYFTLGGNAANASITFARQGLRTSIFTKMGKVKYKKLESIYTFHKLPPEEIEESRSRYLEQITYTDSLFGEFIENLKRRDLFDNALIIVASDHGMSFDSENAGRGRGWINQDIARVPFFLKMPGQRQAKIDNRPVSLIDVYPTIFDILGRKGVQSEGNSLLDSTWDSDRPLITYSIGCDGSCGKDYSHAKFLKKSNHWVPVSR